MFLFVLMIAKNAENVYEMNSAHIIWMYFGLAIFETRFIQSKTDVDEYIAMVSSYYRQRNVQMLSHFTCFSLSKLFVLSSFVCTYQCISSISQLFFYKNEEWNLLDRPIRPIFCDCENSSSTSFIDWYMFTFRSTLFHVSKQAISFISPLHYQVSTFNRVLSTV